MLPSLIGQIDREAKVRKAGRRSERNNPYPPSPFSGKLFFGIDKENY
jgi:hypothetical protein